MIRKSQWTMEGTGLLSCFFKNVNIDYVRNTLTFDYCCMHAYAWADKINRGIIPNECLVFRAYDGCGVFECRFKGIKIIEHNTSFDYKSDEMSFDHFVVSYKSVSKMCYNKIHEPISEVKIYSEDELIATLNQVNCKRPDIKAKNWDDWSFQTLDNIEISKATKVELTLKINNNPIESWRMAITPKGNADGTFIFGVNSVQYDRYLL